MISHLNNFLSGASAESVRSIDTKILALSFTPEAAELREAGSSLLEIVSIQDLGVKTFLPSLPSVVVRPWPVRPGSSAVRERGEFINIHVMPIPL